ncbi:MAG: prepilin-type N-terminal cleavage/methylation domain-containing protein [Desulfobacterales bacterium]|nr:prepilin-type N-terminal cleavage/methylation domain-containing protein [Desulfobacterales bacterium]
MKRLCHKKNSLGNENGFTMIEILVAISIFAIGMLAVASMQVSGIHGNATANALTGAAAWAADRVESLLVRPYDHIDLDPAGNPHSGGTEGRYTISWTVTENDMMPNTKTIAVDVSYSDKGNPKNVSLIYYKSNI